MPAGRCVECKEKMKLEKAGWWQQPPVILRELLHHSSVTEIRLRHKHAEMD
jgi:hypothetical protein